MTFSNLHFQIGIFKDTTGENTFVREVNELIKTSDCYPFISVGCGDCYFENQLNIIDKSENLIRIDPDHRIEKDYNYLKDMSRKLIKSYQ
jgi:hypothetical protein